MHYLFCFSFDPFAIFFLYVFQTESRENLEAHSAGNPRARGGECRAARRIRRDDGEGRGVSDIAQGRCGYRARKHTRRRRRGRRVGRAVRGDRRAGDLGRGSGAYARQHRRQDDGREGEGRRAYARLH